MIPHCSTSMSTSLSLSKLMHPKKGIGVIPPEDGCQVAFASKALTTVEQCYANIEHELLTCVLGAEQFHTYVFGHAFTVESDHKPLEQFTIKNLADTPIHLLRMLLWLSRPMMSPFCIGLAKRCWVQMPSLTMHPQGSRYISRHHQQPCAYHTWQKNSIPGSHTRWPAPLLPCWDNHCRLGRWYQWCTMCSMPIPWPQKHPHSWRWPHPFRWSSHHSSIRKVEDSLSNTWRTHENQQVSKESQTLCVLVWNQLQHQTPQWIMLNRPTSLSAGPQQQLQPTPAPEYPWQLLATDYFHLDVSEYLVVMDYYSKIPIISRIPASQCNASKAISVLKELEQEVFCTNNGTQFPNALFAEFCNRLEVCP